MPAEQYTREQQLEAVRKIKAGRILGKSIYDWPVEIQEAYREYYRKVQAKNVKPPEVRKPSMLLPEDRIIDWIAIEVTVKGIRRVRLTPSERAIAVLKMDEAGLNASAIAERLNSNRDTVTQLLNRIRHSGRGEKILAAIAAGEYEQSEAA